MPFLLYPTKILYFSRRKINNIYLIIIIIINIILILLSAFATPIFIYIVGDSLQNAENNEQYFKEISLEYLISNIGINLLFVIDLELVVFMINSGFFCIYSQIGNKTDFLDFFNNKYWSFFTKSYFSFISISSPIIIYIFYQSESVIELTIENVFLYSLINLIVVLLGNIFLYIFYELPFKKIFKSFILNREYINEEYDPFGDANNFMNEDD